MTTPSYTSIHVDYYCIFALGNYWILPFWVRSPAKQVPIDLQELEWVIQKNKAVHQSHKTEYLELQRKESDIWKMFHVYYAPLLFLVMFIVVAIVVLLRYGPRFLKMRHTTLPSSIAWYDADYPHHTVSYAWKCNDWLITSKG